jgi:transposase-like protein
MLNIPVVVKGSTGLQDGFMSRRKGPRSGGPRPRRSFTPAQKLDLLTRYEQAAAVGEGGAFLRREGLYSSLMSEWRRARDAGLLAGKAPGDSVGRPNADQAEIARLTRELEVTRAKLSRTQTALEIMGKARELLEEVSRSEPDAPGRGRS